MTNRAYSILATIVILGCSSGDVSGGPEETGFNLDAGDVGTDTATASDTTPATDTLTATDTLVPPSDGSSTAMKCGTTTCGAGQECCVTGTAACIPAGSPCAGARYQCTSKTNCGAGEVCCIIGLGGSGASCTTTCPSTTTCDGPADCTGSAKNCVDIGGGVKACTK